MSFFSRFFSFLYLLFVFTPLLSGEKIWITGDVRGAFIPCNNCPARESGPGLGRLVSFLEQNSEGEPVWIDAGGLFSGSIVEGLPTEVKVALAEKMSIQVLHLSYRDVDNASHWKNALQGSSVVGVSANLVDRNGNYVGQPYAVLEHGGQSIGITAVSGISSAYEELPAWRRFFQGVGVKDPLQSLSQALDSMDVDVKIVLYDGDANILRSIQRELGSEIDRIFVSGIFGNVELPKDELIVDARGSQGRSLVELLPSSMESAVRLIPQTGPMSERVQLAFDSANLRSPETVSPSTIAWPESVEWQTGEVQRIFVESENRAFRWTLTGVSSHQEWGDDKAPDGYHFLVFDAFVENRKPFDLIGLDGGQRALRVGDLRQNFILLGNGINVYPLFKSVENSGRYGQFRDTFVLPVPGSFNRGNLVFLVPQEDISPISLIFHHIEYPAIRLDLLDGEVEERWVTIDNWQENPFLRIGVASIQEVQPEDFGLPGESANRFIQVELAGESKLMRENPAPHFERGADPEKKIETARVVPYLYADQHVQIVSSQGYAYLPDWDLSQLPREPIFLGETVTGGRLIFRVPDEIADYEFVAYFPNLGTITGGMIGFQDAMRFPMEGRELLTYPDFHNEIDFGLDTLQVWLSSVEREGDHLVVDAVIYNETDEPGFWEMEERFGLNIEATRTRIRTESLTDQWGNDLPWLLHLPPGEPRRVHLRFPLPEDAGEGLLDVRGVNDNPYIRVTWEEGPGEIALRDREEVEPTPPADETTEPADEEMEERPEQTEVEEAVEEEEESEAPAPRQAVSKMEPRIVPPFDEKYTLRDLGLVPGVPFRYGGIIFHPDDPNTLLMGGDAIEPEGALYAVPLKRDEDGHIVGFRGEAEKYIEAPYNDGGMAFNEDGVLFLARYPVNEIGLVRPGSRTTDKVLPLRRPHNVARSIAGLNFVPKGFPGEGSFKIVTWNLGFWYDVVFEPDGDGLYDIAEVDRRLRLRGGPASFVYVPLGSPLFPEFGMLVSDFSANRITYYEIDERGDPIPQTAQRFIVDLEKAEGALIDPLTGDFLFSTFEVQDRLIAVSGFTAPEPIHRPVEPPAPTPPVVEETPEVEEEPTPPPPPAEGFVQIADVSTADRRFYFILDGSGSMMAPLDGERKFNLARNALISVIEELGENHEVALRAFGNRKRAIEEGANEDTTLEVPMAALTDTHRQRFIGTLRRLRPMGRTPLTLALQEATEDISRMRGEIPITVVLFSDGADDIIPRVDPVPVAVGLVAPSHVNLEMILFDLENEQELIQLERMANATGANLRFSRTGRALIENISATVGLRPRQWILLNEEGERIEEGEGAARLELPPGQYEFIQGDLDNPTKTETITITGGQTIQLEL